MRCAVFTTIARGTGLGGRDGSGAGLGEEEGKLEEVSDSPGPPGAGAGDSGTRRAATFREVLIGPRWLDLHAPPCVRSECG